MRKNIGYVVSWSLYGFGDLVSCIMYFDAMWWVYPVYNRLMLWSGDIQVWGGGAGPWKYHG